VILFQNRRGYSPLVECMTCGLPHCQQCDVSLTYHKHKKSTLSLLGYSIAKPTHCHSCSSVELTTRLWDGTNTTRINKPFPDYKIGRMDQDTTRGKFGFEKIIDSFKIGKLTF
jgi:primosomal protein N' (replication factor Y)